MEHKTNKTSNYAIIVIDRYFLTKLNVFIGWELKTKKIVFCAVSEFIIKSKEFTK